MLDIDEGGGANDYGGLALLGGLDKDGYLKQVVEVSNPSRSRKRKNAFITIENTKKQIIPQMNA